MSTLSAEAFDTAFSKQSEIFDHLENKNVTSQWLRKTVHETINLYLAPNSQILELNGGTGIDAILFAQQGHQVLLTDGAEGMVKIAKEKVAAIQLNDKIKTQLCNYESLSQIEQSNFDFIFSNNGGLNCTNELSNVLETAYSKLKSGGFMALVVMPKICPWELIMVFKLKMKMAFRRLLKNGTKANVEGETVMCYYYNPSYIKNLFKGRMEVKVIKGICSIIPPEFIYNFPLKHPKIFKWLEKKERKLSVKFPFNTWCDQYVIVLQKN
jgi:ubiquinone/menaquinone biosynthesis C-methylase UbiE